jgi:hypothetical protein
MRRIVIGGSGSEDIEAVIELAQILEGAGACVLEVGRLGDGGLAYTMDISKDITRDLRQMVSAKVVPLAA